MSAAKKKKISDYLPEKETAKKRYLQAMVPPELYEATKAKMKEQGATWDELVEACFRHYTQE